MLGWQAWDREGVEAGAGPLGGECGQYRRGIPAEKTVGGHTPS